MLTQANIEILPEMVTTFSLKIFRSQNYFTSPVNNTRRKIKKKMRNLSSQYRPYSEHFTYQPFPLSLSVITASQQQMKEIYDVCSPIKTTSCSISYEEDESSHLSACHLLILDFSSVHIIN
jgi:hypothetical protein